MIEHFHREKCWFELIGNFLASTEIENSKFIILFFIVIHHLSNRLSLS